MHSIQDLNNYSGTTLSYTDERAPSITFSVEPPINHIVELANATPHAGVVGTDITEIINYDQVSVVYTVNLAPYGSNVTATWANIPSTVASSNPSSGQYVFSNIARVSDWEAVKSPTLTPTGGFTGNWQYTGNISYTIANVANSRSWTTYVYSSAVDYYLTSIGDASYDKNTLETITDYPSVNDPGANASATFTVDVFPNNTSAISTVSSSGSAVRTFDYANKILSITGNKAEVNSTLATLSFQPGLDFSANFSLAYKLTDPSGTVITRYQNYSPSANLIVSNLTSNIGFTRNLGSQTIFANSIPQITETVSGAYYTLILNSSAGQFGTDTNNMTTTYSISGNATTINSQVAGIKFWPYRDVTGAQSLNVKLNRNSVEALNTNVTLSGSGDGATGQTITFTTSQYWTPTYDQLYYYDFADMLLVGSGGTGNSGAWFGTSGPAIANIGFGGGGSGGQAVEHSGYPYANETYQIVIGAGGGTTYFKNNAGATVYSAAGGSSALGNTGASYGAYYGGTGQAYMYLKTGQYIPGGPGWTSGATAPPAASGGGAGFSQNGYPADIYGVAGNGGAGFSSSITGNTYCGGGGGWGGYTQGQGADGGGAGGYSTYAGSLNGVAGSINRGGGGGGGLKFGGAGGSGVVVIKFSN